jgi:hypothetical protein
MWVIGDFAQAMQHLKWVRETLERGDTRRAEAGMIPRPNSELRYQCIGIKSACCLEDMSVFETVSPELETSMMSSEFWRLAEASVEYLKEKDELESEESRTVVHGVARWELEICKLCERYNPAFVALALDFFNNRIGYHLELVHKHFHLLEANESRSSWYWDFELSKLESRGDYDRAEVLLCASQRSASARLTYTKDSAGALHQPWARQVARMLNLIGQ